MKSIEKYLKGFSCKSKMTVPRIRLTLLFSRHSVDKQSTKTKYLEIVFKVKKKRKKDRKKKKKN